MKNYSNLTFFFLIFLLFCLQLPVSGQISPTNFDPQKIVFVDNEHPGASDFNSGIERSSPLKTLQHAINVCKNITAKIIVASGHYRSYLDIVTNKTIIIEAEEPGTVFISGSDVFKKWAKSDSLYWHTWPYDWGFFADSASCFGDCHLSDYQKRREMVFVDGKPLLQVLHFDQLKKGTFYIDEKMDKVFINMENNTHPDNHNIEVATRGYDVYDQGRNGSLVKIQVYNGKGLIIKGIVFQHVANTMHQDALTITNTDNVIMEDCIFQWNNGVGVEFFKCNNVSMQNCVIRNNGERGMGVGSGENFFFNNLKIYGNNWRTNADKIIAHDAAGIKIFGSTKNVIIDNSEVYNNFCNAVWFDWNNENYIIRNSRIYNNQEAGIMVEGSRKRALIENCEIYNNNSGIKGYGHANVTVENCKIYANDTQLTFGQDGRIVTQDNNWEIDSKDWKLYGNMIYATEPSQKIFTFFEYSNPNVPSTKSVENFFETVRSDFNTYYHPDFKNIFPDGESLFETPLSLSKWTEKTKQDRNSKFELPSF